MRSSAASPPTTSACWKSFYDNWASGFDLSPVLTIKSDDLDFVHKPRHLETVMGRVHSILAGKEEMEFPKGN